MQQRELEIVNKLGLHARASADYERKQTLANAERFIESALAALLEQMGDRRRSGLEVLDVDMDRERASFADNAIKYEATLRFINSNVRTSLSAITSRSCRKPCRSSSRARSRSARAAGASTRRSRFARSRPRLL